MRGWGNIHRSLIFGYLLMCYGVILFVTVVLREDASRRQYGRAAEYRIDPGHHTLTQNASDINTVKHRSIPKIIHQIWNDDVIPEVFHDNIRGLVGHNKHPDWTYCFWTMESGYRLMQDTFPGLTSRYSNADNQQKADILRLVVLYQYGGVYFDLDTVSVKPLDPYMDTHECSLFTEPSEHVFNTDQSEPVLLITNSAIVCKPFNWFFLYIIQQLANQSVTCTDAVSCTGSRFISKHYAHLQSTNRSADLPVLEDYQYFQSMVSPEAGEQLNTLCKEPLAAMPYAWSQELCRKWISRDREQRTISEKAYTYHTWFPAYLNSSEWLLMMGTKLNISELVKNVTFYSS